MNSSRRPGIAILLTNIVCLCLLSSTHSQSSTKVFGSVTDEMNTGIGNAEVTLYSLDRIARVAVDSQGRFRFDNVAAGSYELEAVAPSFKTVTRHLDVRGGGGDIPLDISLRIAATDSDCWNGDSVSYGQANGTIGARLNGTVAEINQKSKFPIANARVTLFNGDVKVREQQTNERGEFDFYSVSPGRYLIVVTHPKYRDLRSRIFWVARENWTRITFDPIPADKIRVCP